MLAGTSASASSDQRFKGTSLPIRFYLSPMAIALAGLGAMVLLGLSPSALFLAFAGFGVFLMSVSFGGSLFSNYISLREDHLIIAVWIAVPVHKHRVPYEEITRVEADDVDGNLGVWWVSEDGNPNVAEIILRTPTDASKVKDAIRSRASLDGWATERDTPSIEAEVERIEIPPEGFYRRFDMETPPWMWWLPVASAVLGGIAAFAESGEFSRSSFAGLAVFCAVIGLIMIAIFRYRTFTVLRSDRIELSSGIGESHTIKFTDVIDASGHEGGWLMVKYTKKATLGLGGGETEATVHLKRRGDAAALATAILAARERVLNVEPSL